MTVLPQLERMLVQQAARRARPIAAAPRAGLEALAAPRRLRVSRRSAVLALLAALVLGGAVAATTVWTPLLGTEHAGRPTVSATPPSPAALKLLGVLRRAQTPADRDAQTQTVLRLLGPQLHGVRTRYIRKLEADIGGAAVTLVPVESFSEPGEAFAVPLEGGFVCVLYPFPQGPRGASLNCWSPSEIAGGSAIGVTRGADALHVFGLVPDGVATVTIELADGSEIAAAVRENFFDAPESSTGFERVRAIRWQAAEGAVIGPPLNAETDRSSGAR